MIDVFHTRVALILGAMVAAALALPSPGWAAPVTLSDGGFGPALAVAPDGTALVAWTAYDDTTRCSDIRYALVAPDDTVQAEAGLPDAGACPTSPDVVANPDGSFTVAWSADGGGRPDGGRLAEIRMSRIAPDGTAGAGEVIGTADKARPPEIAGAPDGSSVIVYRGPEAGGRSFRARAVQIGAAGSPGPEIEISRAETDGFDVAVDGRGRALIAWSSGSGSAGKYQSVQARTLRPAGTLTKLRTLSRPGEGGKGVTVEAAGSRAVVAWLGRKGVRASGVDGTGRPLRSAVTLSRKRDGLSSPRAALTPSGRATVVWSQKRSGRTHVVGSGLSPHGRALPATTIVEDGRGPALTTASRDVLLGWAEGWNEGSFFGTFRTGGEPADVRPLFEGTVFDLILAADGEGVVSAAGTVYDPGDGVNSIVFVRGD